MRVLIFGTCYVDTKEKRALTHQWGKLHRHLNPGMDLLLVDSNSPMYGLTSAEVPRVFSFSDNIGHLSQGGGDGWGRAFCRGLEFAMKDGYDYVVHIEGDSLFRLPVSLVIDQMVQDGINVASVPIGYGEAQRSSWVETGLMFISVDYLKQSHFIAGYDWPNRTAKPQPEIVIRKLLGSDLVMLPLKAERSDKDEITVDNVTEYDWITHCAPEVYDRFVEGVLE